jgi:hypothetical protein
MRSRGPTDSTKWRTIPAKGLWRTWGSERSEGDALRPGGHRLQSLHTAWVEECRRQLRGLTFGIASLSVVYLVAAAGTFIGRKAFFLGECL